MTDLLSSAEASAERTYSGIAVTERAALRRLRFIEVGIELFGTLGYHATTMWTLTAATGLTNRYFYESFETMEDLLVACYEKLMQDYRDRLSQVLDQASEEFEPRIRNGLRCYFEALINPQFARITHSEVLGISRRLDDLYNRYTAGIAELMMDYLQGDGGQPAEQDLLQMQYVGVALAGAVIHAGVVWVRSGLRPQSKL
ncbi:TetR/AcrR family transcriptional regulator [Pseudomonas sp. ML96]|uniref:TetR/AcrR family transcriptional regulator n=1 Tax=Pseudomonas sp. ML96 TaxID=1523503 RepID=UPI0005B94FC6|nr:TetR/AcrR family transcriptional regulator [Pseudomonas sp. ML96]